MFANTKDEFALVLFGTEGMQHNNHTTFIVSHPLRVKFFSPSFYSSFTVS